MRPTRFGSAQVRTEPAPCRRRARLVFWASLDECPFSAGRIFDLSGGRASPAACVATKTTGSEARPRYIQKALQFTFAFHTATPAELKKVFINQCLGSSTGGSSPLLGTTLFPQQKKSFGFVRAYRLSAFTKRFQRMALASPIPSLPSRDATTSTFGFRKRSRRSRTVVPWPCRSTTKRSLWPSPARSMSRCAPRAPARLGTGFRSRSIASAATGKPGLSARTGGVRSPTTRRQGGLSSRACRREDARSDWQTGRESGRHRSCRAAPDRC